MSIAIDLIFEGDGLPEVRLRLNMGLVFENGEPSCPIDVASGKTVAHHMVDVEGRWGWRLDADPERRVYRRMFVMAAGDQGAEFEPESKAEKVRRARASGMRTFGFADGRVFAAPIAASPAPQSVWDVVDRGGAARPPWREL
jgi:hypothetical protein